MQDSTRRSLIFVFATLAALLVAQASGLRQVENFNREWSFKLGDTAGAEAAEFNDASWDRIGLPHSFSTPYFAATNSFYVGYGWYRKIFDVPAEWQGKRLFLHFEGAFQDADISLNGQKVGAHQGGYTGFEIELTDAAVRGRNVVAVRLNNHWKPRLAPRAGEHQFSGGIYRNVWLVATDPLHVTWFGTSVTTPAVSAAAGTVNVKTEVVNQSSAAKNCTLRTEVLDAAGESVATMNSPPRRIAPGQMEIFDQASAPIANPQLWTPDHPNLYSVKTTVLDSDRPVDDVVSPLGFRWFKFTADRGFFFNGEHHYFKGANVHQDHAGWGDAVADSGFSRDVQLIKDAGFEFIRGSHYPHAPAFAAACDRIGMLFWSENCFWGIGSLDDPWGGSAYPTDPADEPGFEASVRASLRDMIRIHRNHPSIVVWSMSNEVFFSDPKVKPKVQRFLRELVAYSHELDPTRPAGIGGAQRGDIEFADIAGYNGDGVRLFPNPGIPNVVSEYGSTIGDRPGVYAPGWGELPYTPGADKDAPGSWRLPWRSGEVIWCGFDHGSIAGRTFGAMGLVDYFRLPKRQWYWYRNEYRGVPPPTWPQAGEATALRLSADKTTLRAVDGTDDAHVVVTVVDKNATPLSNCPPVTLTIESGPGEFPTGPSITFDAKSDIPIRDGMAAIEFRSYYAGETLIRATSPGLEDATIRITSLGDPQFVPGVTPPTAPRPYQRFSAAPSKGTWDKFGLENPTRTSSEAPGHTGPYANDGNPNTVWWAATRDTNPWLRVDLERVVTIKTVRSYFAGPGVWRYRIEVSNNGESDWQVFVEDGQTETPNMWSSRVVEGAKVTGRFLRVTLLGWPEGISPGIADLTVSGTINSN